MTETGDLLQVREFASLPILNAAVAAGSFGRFRLHGQRTQNQGPEVPLTAQVRE